MKKCIYLVGGVFAYLSLISMVVILISPQYAQATGCDLQITKLVDKTKVSAGEQIMYTLYMKNEGHADCTGGGVELQEYYDPQTTYVGASVIPTIGNSNWNFWTVEPGEDQTVLVWMTVNSDVSAGDSIVNQACVWAEQFGSHSDSSAWRCTTVESSVIGDGPTPPNGGGPTVTIATSDGGGQGGYNIPKISLKKASTNPIAYPGQTISYTLTVSSTGTKNADDVTVEDTLPTGFTFADTKSSKKSWKLGNIPNGENKTVSYSVVIDPAIQTGVYENVAVATMNDGFEPDNRSEARATVTVQSPSASFNVAKLTIDKSVSQSKVLAGNTLSYSVTVKNVGETEAVNVTMKDILPSGFTFVDTKMGEQTFDLGNLAIGVSKTIEYSVQTASTIASGVYRNVAYAQAANTQAVGDTSEVYVDNPAYQGLKILPKTGAGLWEFVFPGALAFVMLSLAVLILRRKDFVNKSL